MTNPPFTGKLALTSHPKDNKMPTVLPRHLRLSLSLIAVLLLAACDTSQLLPPDARLPDGSTYTGDIEEGLFHGEGPDYLYGDSE